MTAPTAPTAPAASGAPRQPQRRPQRQVVRPAGLLSRQRAATVFSGTPGRLRLLGGLAILLVVVFGFAAGIGEVGGLQTDISNARSNAAQLVRIQTVLTSLVQADANATNAFLVGGLEPAAEETAYTQGISTAASTLAEASSANPSDVLAFSLASVNQALAIYTGLIESARANNPARGFPVGAAHLRQASTTLQQRALPPLAALVRVEQQRVNDSIAQGGNARAVMATWLLIALIRPRGAAGCLVVHEDQAAGQPADLVATLMVLVFGLVGLAVLGWSQSRTNDVRSGAYAQTVALATAVEGFDAKSAEALTLINRGNGQDYETLFESLSSAASNELQTLPSANAPETATATDFSTYLSAHKLPVRALDDGGNWDQVAATATGTGVANRDFDAFQADSSKALDAQAAHLSKSLKDAGAPLGVLAGILLRRRARGRRLDLARGLSAAGGIPMTARMRARLAVVMALVAVALVACSSSSSSSTATLPPLGLSSTTTTAPAGPTTIAPAVDCGNPVASFAPSGPLPHPGGPMPANSEMATILKRGRLIAGVSADTLLFSYRNPLTGAIEGFDVDMVRQVAQAIFGDPNKVQYKIETYAQRIPDLLSGAVDIVADVMTINCSRWQQIDFSSQYYEAGQKVLVSSNASKAKSIDDLDGQTVCAAEGSTNIQELADYPKVKVVPVADVSDCMVLFQEGKVDAVTGDDTVLAGFVAQDPYAKVVGPDFTSEPYGLGIAKTHTEFVRFVNQVIAQMRTDGTWKSMYSKWLKPTGPVPDPPPAVYGRNP